jgi:hypothetical protein
MVYNTEVVKLLVLRQFTRVAPLVIAAVALLCLGTLLSWHASGFHDLPTLAAASAPHATQRAHGDEGPGSGHLAVAVEELGDGDRSPVNAGLLTSLLLAASLGQGLVWPLAGNTRRAAPCGAWSRFATAREYRPLLGVFRL